jgi:ribose transport system substrate-binding protein
VEEMIAELRRNDSPAVASVSHEVSQYGEYLMRLGLSLLRGEIVPPYNFTQYEVVSRENLPVAGS